MDFPENLLQFVKPWILVPSLCGPEGTGCGGLNQLPHFSSDNPAVYGGMYMMITNKIKLDLQRPGTAPTIHAVQTDSYSRNLEIALFAGQKPFVFPDQGAVLIRYRKSDGKGGEYDTLPDGTSAWRAEKHRLTIALAPQVLTTPGSVLLSVTLIADGAQLSMFPVRLSVEPIAAAKTAKSEDYFYTTGLLPAPGSGKPGQYLRISAVNDQGRITALEAVDSVSPQKGIDYWTETDRAALVQDVLAALGTPVFGTVDAEKNITLTGELPDGTYTLKYEDAEGNLTVIGTLVHRYNLADPSSEAWLTDYRPNSSGGVTALSGSVVANFIPCQTGDVIRIKGLNIAYASNGSRTYAYFFASDQTTAIARNIPAEVDGWVNSGDCWTYTVGTDLTVVSGDLSRIRCCRLGGRLYDGYTAEDVIITVNREIL